MHSTSSVQIEIVTGNRINQYIESLAQLRIDIFRVFPYLYDGNKEYEKKYLQTYIQSPNSVIIVALDNENVVGASTAVPLQYETTNVQFPFIDAGIDTERVFYFGESVLKRDYRGKGIGVRFFDERLRFAKQRGDFEYATFCGVNRPIHHPRRPKDYIPLDDFWRNRGFEKQPNMKAFYTWRDLDEKSESAKEMIFWMKKLK